MMKPVPNFEQEWLKRVAKNFVSRQKIRRIVKFISENINTSFPASQSSTFQLDEQTSSKLPDIPLPSPSEKKGKATSKEKRLLRTNSVKVKMPVLYIV
ncbi:hypothetical protein AVEN_128386-1 [Araneus ventricosus]|uniref:Uncharacterized protein n=1 Tax=Araneus ventricosus TaxID=182803 RepID=A0A4Y2WGC6_ARAVE|nr:hypothetical protein AVEN_9734-1 [Araneus ventricosus]GBO35704.1 hypothetical protein AVEN_128386-1 [Araneus ventricosus]